MIQLVVYSDSSSEDEDRRSSSSHCCEHLIQAEGSEEDVCPSGDPGRELQEKRLTADLPITDESDDQSNHAGSSSNGRPYKQPKVCSVKKHQQRSPHGSPESGTKVLSATTDKKLEAQSECPGSIPSKDPSEVLNETNVCNSSTISEISSAGKKIFLKSSHNFSETTPKLQDKLESMESQPKSPVNRKRKLNSSSDKQLPVPDVIHTMYHGKHQGWVDDPGLHDNRVRSFPHLEGNWATHVFIPVPKNDQFVRFVDHLLELLVPQTFQAHQDFHISLSRTVAIRYHWIEPLVDSLRENLKDLKSCISDLTGVKLFTNDEKTRTFVSIELSQEEREFMDYVKAVDKSFVEFKLPAYYQKPSFHISVGWCLGDVVGKISSEKLLEAQELLGEFVADSPILGFVYAHEICCQSGCKSFVMTLKDSDK